MPFPGSGWAVTGWLVGEGSATCSGVTSAAVVGAPVGDGPGVGSLPLQADVPRISKKVKPT